MRRSSTSLFRSFWTRRKRSPTTSTRKQVEDIFAHIPQQKTSLVFTPQAVVKMMVDSP